MTHKLNKTAYDDVRTTMDILSTDSLILNLTNHTPLEIEDYIADQFSAIANLSDVEIDAYLDANIVDIVSVKAALKTIAKDSARTMSILKTVTKMTVFLAKKELGI